MVVDPQVLLALAFGIGLAVLLIRFFYVPLRLLLLFLVNSTLGGAVLWGLNWLGGFVGFHIGLNPVTAAVTGLFGLPGLALLVALKYLG